MAIWVGRCLVTTPWDSSDLGVVSWIAKVRTTITSAILAPMGQVKSLATSMRRVDVDSIRDRTTKLWRYEADGGFQPQQLKENVYLAPTLKRVTKVTWRWSNGPVQDSRGLSLWQNVKQRGLHGRWPVEGKIAKYVLACYSVALATRW